MKIYTRKGDSGDTSLIDGKIVYKHNLSVAAYGTIDELNSFLGLLKDYIDDEKIKDVLNTIQLKAFFYWINISLRRESKHLRESKNRKKGC